MADNGIYGHIYISSGTINLHQDSGSYVDLNGSPQQSGGTVNIHGGISPAYFGYDGAATLTMSGGVLDYKNVGIELRSVDNFTDAITGGTIRSSRTFNCGRADFNPSGGIVELTGSADAQVIMQSTSWFWTLKVNKTATRDGSEPMFETDREGNVHPVSRLLNLTIGACTIKGGYIQAAANSVYLGGDMSSLNAGNLTINNGVLRTESHDLISSGNVVINNGVLAVDPGSSLKLSNARSVTVNSGGQLLLGGNSSSAAILTHNTTGYYALNIESGGTLSATHGIFEYMDANGVWLKPGSLVGSTYPLEHCTFRNGASGGRLLWINNSQSLNLVGAYFPTNTWGGAYNVSKTADAGSIYFSGWSGAFGGPTFEQDPHSRLWWEGSGVPPIEDLAISYVLATNSIQLSWSYPLEATEYKIYRSATPEGTFLYVGSTTNQRPLHIVIFTNNTGIACHPGLDPGSSL
ncbi:MAG: hypothetical protein K0B87_04900 [Candidatus Syntrophosphaera sp.]|nr:hypothetical protein [Candidatus Syntrophosphaera sp.]